MISQGFCPFSFLFPLNKQHFQGKCSQKNKSLNKCRRYLSRVDKYRSSAARRLAVGLPLCIGNYQEAAVATGWVMMMGACGDVVGVTVEAGNSPS